jgi:hypothetical protein
MYLDLISISSIIIDGHGSPIAEARDARCPL